MRSPDPGKDWKEDVNGPGMVERTRNKFRYFITEIFKLFLHRIPFTLIHKIGIEIKPFLMLKHKEFYFKTIL